MKVKSISIDSINKYLLNGCTIFIKYNNDYSIVKYIDNIVVDVQTNKPVHPCKIPIVSACILLDEVPTTIAYKSPLDTLFHLASIYAYPKADTNKLKLIFNK